MASDVYDRQMILSSQRTELVYGNGCPGYDRRVESGRERVL